MSRRQVSLILIAICAIMILIASVYKMSNSIQVEGWDDFKKVAIDRYSFVTDVNLDSITPADLRVNYTINRKIDMEEIDKIFIYTRNYVLSEKVFNDLKKIHSKKFKYSFANINVVFIYRENNNYFGCKIFSPQDIDGEPNYNNFKMWYIKLNNEPTKEYTPMS